VAKHRAASKTRFFEAAGAWRAADVATMAREQPAFVAARDARGRTALHICARRAARGAAAAQRALATAKALVAAGADIDAVQPIRDGDEIFPATALWYALGWGRNRRLGAYLLARGADPNHCLFALVWLDDLASAKLVRRYGADLDELGHGETPLIYAIRHRRARFAEWLLRQGADATIPGPRGYTPLHHAVRRRLPSSTLRLLVRRGADAHAVADDGISVAELATRAQRRSLSID
jgi:ankyrin repeat protein